jgi:hypothetical protein
LSQSKQPPVTQEVSPERLMAVLDYRGMLDLAALFREWALLEASLSPEQRSKLSRQSAEFEAVADFCGPEWQASAPEVPLDPLAFVARELSKRPADPNSSTS